MAARRRQRAGGRRVAVVAAAAAAAQRRPSPPPAHASGPPRRASRRSHPHPSLAGTCVEGDGAGGRAAGASHDARRDVYGSHVQSRSRLGRCPRVVSWRCPHLENLPHLVHFQPGRGVIASLTRKSACIRKRYEFGWFDSSPCRLPSAKGAPRPAVVGVSLAGRPAVGTSPAWLPRQLPGRPKQV